MKNLATESAEQAMFKLLTELDAKLPENEDCGLNLVSVENYQSQVGFLWPCITAPNYHSNRTRICRSIISAKGTRAAGTPRILEGGELQRGWV